MIVSLLLGRGRYGRCLDISSLHAGLLGRYSPLVHNGVFLLAPPSHQGPPSVTSICMAFAGETKGQETVFVPPLANVQAAHFADQ